MPNLMDYLEWRGDLTFIEAPLCEVLFESWAGGIARGHTPSFIEVACPVSTPCQAQKATVRIERHDGLLCFGNLTEIKTERV